MTNYSTKVQFELWKSRLQYHFCSVFEFFPSFRTDKTNLFLLGANERLGNFALCTTLVKNTPKQPWILEQIIIIKKSKEVLSKCSLFFHWLYRQGIFHYVSHYYNRYYSASSVMQLCDWLQPTRFSQNQRKCCRVNLVGWRSQHHFCYNRLRPSGL